TAGTEPAEEHRPVAKRLLGQRHAIGADLDAPRRALRSRRTAVPVAERDRHKRAPALAVALAPIHEVDRAGIVVGVDVAVRDRRHARALGACTRADAPGLDLDLRHPAIL